MNCSECNFEEGHSQACSKYVEQKDYKPNSHNKGGEKIRSLQNNKRGEWYPAIPLPYYGVKKQCKCGESFWKEKNYEAHYALEHIILGNKPL